MKTVHKEFFATREDFLPGIQQLESKEKLKYVLMGAFQSPTPACFYSASDIPDLGLSHYGHYISEQSFLVTYLNDEIIVQEQPQRKGEMLFAIDLRMNPTGFVFQPAGRYGENTIICGSLGTATGDFISLKLCKQFWREMSQDFTKIGEHYLGPRAYLLLQQGWLLTAATQSPPEFDIRI